ncbi:hypothetical protein HID58_019181 [Brassica napus]|uniref:(rape) hypothetical protein n=1 Tax=Brassica napus TaxID=3708 RepID=A0A816TSX8_BRANA|nr:cyclin-dependent kinase inhibitor 6-like [Brassica napus]KAH0926925.1 hypothetical protein HID58_019181 [Brassica napus]CAF2100382.1 unnamed protein product [Brassica napus]
MSERNLNSKRESRELEASSTSVSPLQKKKKLDDSSADSNAVVLAIPSPSVASSQGRCSVTSDDDDKSSIVSSGCFSSESNETVRNNPTSGADLEDTASEALGETTETEMESSSPALKRDNKPPEVSKIPTAEEIEAFLSELEGGEDKQKRFIEKYNFDIVNDKPLQGRYMWDRLKP